MKTYESKGIEHKGKHEHRLTTNPIEAVFLEEWKKQQTESHTLQWLLCTSPNQDTQDRELTQAEATCAATLMQWLGSPVGSVWLDDTMFKAKQVVSSGFKRKLNASR